MVIVLSDNILDGLLCSFLVVVENRYKRWIEEKREGVIDKLG